MRLIMKSIFWLTAVLPLTVNAFHNGPSVKSCYLFGRPAAAAKKFVQRPPFYAEFQDNEPSSRKSILETVDKAGLSLKPRAIEARDQATEAEERTKKTLYSAKACAFFMLFIVYRAYRGFFVILPEVFREVYRKLEKAVDKAPFDEEEDLLPTSGDVPFRTRATISVLSAVLTLSYVLGGALRVFGKFFREVRSSKSVTLSFEAAADELIVNQDKILRRNNGKTINGHVQNNTDLAP